MDGNLSKAGFTKDFEALAEAGMGGAIVFHIGRGIPTGPTDFASDEFNSILAHAAVEAKRVGIDMGLHNCDGWSSSGGPWVTPEMSMKKVVWQDAVVSSKGQPLTFTPPKMTIAEGFYRDIAVLAWPASKDVAQLAKQKPTYSTSLKDKQFGRLFDGNIDTEFRVRTAPDGSRWLQASYDEPVTIRSVHMEQRSRNGKGALWTSNDGKTFEKIADLDQLRIGKYHWSFHKNFPQGVTAKHFRVVLNSEFLVRRFELTAYPRMANWQARNAMSDQLSLPIPIFLPRQSSLVMRSAWSTKAR